MAHEQHRECIEACQACADACDHCATACLQEANITEMARCIALDIDCAQICRYAAGVMARGSDFAGSVCQLCADICDACAEECEQHSAGHCQRCAAACRRCAEICRQMANNAPSRRTSVSTSAPAH